MMKKIAISFVWFFGCIVFASAQITTNTRALNETATGLKLAWDANYAKALELAKRNGWALTITSKDGRKAQLVGVTEFGLPQYYITHNNTIAAATTRANQLWPGGSSGLNLSGSSANMKNKLGIWDGGAVLSTHQELTGRITQKDNPASTDDHATHVSGTMIASGVNPIAKGMAYGLQGMIAYDYANDYTEMASEASGLVLSNHSYGFIAGWYYNSSSSRWEYWGDVGSTEDYNFGYYDKNAQTLDSIAYNAPFYLIVKSAGNNRGETGPAVGSPYYRYNASGQMISAGNRPAGISSNDSYDGIVDDIGAKNILTVGAVNGLPGGYNRKEDVVMSSFSDWGPTDDGRIKPDIVADGVNVTSSIATTNSSYASFSGTSMATPNSTGSLLLLQEYYSKLKSGSFMRSATLKGLAIHTADEAGTSPGPDYQFGWGLLDVQKAAAVITAAVSSNNAASSPHLLYENTLANGGSFNTTVIATGKGPLTATICWTDVKGTPVTFNILNNRTKMLVNDLDIRITKGSGSTLSTYYPWTLDVNNPSLPAVQADNSTDNVERIDVDSTVPGQTYTISISHKGTLQRGSQAYSLLVSNVGGAGYCSSISGGGGARIDSVSFNTLHAGNTAGSKTYTDNTRFVTNIEPSQVIPLAVKVSTADATTNSRIVKVFIDFNNNGLFDSNELVATSSVLSSAAQFYNTSITIPSSVTIGSTCLMRVIVQETALASDVAACGSYTKGETQDYRLKVVDPSNDIVLNQVTIPAQLDCASTAQYLTVNIKNNGTVDQSNIPLSVAIGTGSTTVANLTYTLPGPIPALTDYTYTFQTPFATSAGTTYTVTATASLANDQNPSNNTLVKTITTGAKPAAVAASGEICGTSVTLKVTNPDLSNYFWYSTSSSNTPFALGSTVTTSTIPTDKTYYVAKEAKTGIGPANKTVLGTGGYNTWYNNFVRINNTVPVIIESARMYIGNPGKVLIKLINITSETSSSISYSELYSTSIDVYATTKNPAPGTGADASTDTGAIYTLNIPVNSIGDHALLVQCLSANGRSDSSSIFRNNNISVTPYPISIPNILSITGNSATLAGVTNGYYYFFYDMKINTIGCGSDRSSVVAVTAPVPVITQVADSLVSSVASGNQWYLNDTAINGATGKSYKPTKSGKYKVMTADAFNCVQTSNAITFTVTAIADVLAQEIKLNVSPNPNNGVFNLSFEVKTKADLTIDLLSESGQRVYTSSYPAFTGKFSKQITLNDLSSAFYFLKIQHDKKTYVQKIMIIH